MRFPVIDIKIPMNAGTDNFSVKLLVAFGDWA